MASALAADMAAATTTASASHRIVARQLPIAPRRVTPCGMETLTESPPPPTPPVRRSLRRYSPPVLIAVILFHLLAGGLATIWVVSKYSAARKLTFQAGPKSPNPSERALEHRVHLQEKMNTLSAPPAVPQRVLTTGAAKITLPPMPEMNPAAPTAPMAMTAGGRAPAFGAGAAAAMSGGLANGNGVPINFFGIKDLSNSVVIMIDVSNSMFTRTGDAIGRKLIRQGKAQAFQAVRDEAIKLVQSLTPQTRFDLIHWAGSARAWQPALVPATEANKAAAIAHIQEAIDFDTAKPEPGKPGGTRHDYALKLAFSLQAETLYMLTDGNATAYQPGSRGLKNIPPEALFKITEEGQKTLPKKARLHTIYYLNAKEKDEERAMLQHLAGRNGGQFKIVRDKVPNE